MNLNTFCVFLVYIKLLNENDYVYQFVIFYDLCRNGTKLEYLQITGSNFFTIEEARRSMN